MVHDKKIESVVAVGSFLAAVGLAFTSLVISPDHDIAAGVLMMCACAAQCPAEAIDMGDLHYEIDQDKCQIGRAFV